MASATICTRVSNHALTDHRFFFHIEILKLTSEDHNDREHLYSAKDVANKIASVHEGQEEITARVINNLITSVKNCPVCLIAMD
jgi:hypothetical protein